jgi:hypothetical protein
MRRCRASWRMIKRKNKLENELAHFRCVVCAHFG